MTFAFRTIASVVAFASLVLVSSAGAATPPAQLLNKTVVVAFSVMWPGSPGALSVQRMIYVSTKGRIFVRGTRSGGSSSDSNDVAPGDYRYEGGRIIGHYRLNTGANQIPVSFDPGFTSCSAVLQYGRPGSEAYRGTGPDGATRTTNAAPNVSGVSCSIRDGNLIGQ